MASLVNRLRNKGGFHKPSMAELHIEDPTMMKDLLKHECDSSLHFGVETGTNQFTANSAEMDIMDPSNMSNEEIKQVVTRKVESVFVESYKPTIPAPDIEVPEYVVIPKPNRVDTHGASIEFKDDTGHICETGKGIRHYSAVLNENKE